jgi:predicted negative regulator of RcsB-dependent stress response
MSTDTAGLVLAIGIIIASGAALGWFAWAASRWEADRAARKHAARHWDGKR